MKNKIIIIGIFLSFIMIMLPFNNIVSSTQITFIENFDNDLINHKASNGTWFNTSYTPTYFTVASVTTITSPNSFKLSSSAGSGDKSGQFNFNQTNISSLSFAFKQSIITTSINLISFRTTTGIVLFDLGIRRTDIVYNPLSSPVSFCTINSSVYKLVFTFITTSTCNISVYYKTLTGYYYVGGHLFGMGALSTVFKKIHFISYEPTASTNILYIDNLIMITGISSPPLLIGNHIKFKYYDGQTGDEITMYNYANGNYKPVDSVNPMCGMMSIGSSLFTGYYFDDGNNNKKLDIINVSFTEGQYYDFNITSALYYSVLYFLGFPITHLQNSNNVFQLYDNITISIILYPIGYSNYGNIRLESHDGLIWGLRTDKVLYQYPEQVRIQYMFPRAVDMLAHGKPLDSNWKIYISDIANLNMGDAEYKSQGGYVYDAQWHDLTPFNPPDTVDGQDKFNCFMFRNSWIPGVYDIYVDGPQFTVIQATTFIPSGNITSILPYPVNIGEDITITFNANNNGRIIIKHIPTNENVLIQEFDKPVTSGTIKGNFARVGLFEVSLYVYFATNISLEDTQTFYINVTGDAYEEWGYNTPYLMVEGDKIITEYDYLIIYYKSMVNNTEIRIESPRHSRAPFSTSVSNKTGGILKIPFKSWMGIGQWNVSMNISTYPYILHDYFHVIANEQNFIDFPKNEYYLNESISFYIRHDVRCKIIFLKGDISRGIDIFFENGTLVEGNFQIIDTSFFDIGTWTIQMWQTNNRIPIRLLAEDTIIFKEQKIVITPLTGVFGFTISPPLSYFIGVAIIVLLTISPLLLGYVVGGRIDLSTIPQFLYMILAIVGFIVDILLGFFPTWSIPVLIIITTIIIAIMWQQKKIA